MTTSHRPTFETRKGRDLQPTAIVHSRKVAAHRQLKYRKPNINEDDARSKFDELKQDLIKRESDHYKAHDGVHAKPQLQLQDEKEVAHPEEETFEERRKRVAAETADLDDSDSDDNDNNDINENDGSGSDSESDDSSDDEEELLKELEKIKKERAEAQAQKELQIKEEEAMNNNPLLKPNPIRKNWRQDKIFSYKNNKEKTKTDDDYVNDLLKSDFHQKFLNKYVK